MSLKEKMMRLNSNEGIPFMKDRTKGEIKEILDKNVTIKDFDFITGNDGEYVVFIIDEVKDTFYFGGSVLTNNLKMLSDEEKEEVKREGLPVYLYEAKSKNNRKYVGAKFYPEETQDDLPF